MPEKEKLLLFNSFFPKKKFRILYEKSPKRLTYQMRIKTEKSKDLSHFFYVVLFISFHFIMLYTSRLFSALVNSILIFNDFCTELIFFSWYGMKHLQIRATFIWDFYMNENMISSVSVNKCI